jgi:tetratricopeptide (TPR) repeat protein
MKRLLAVVFLLLVLAFRVRADGADDQYVQIYNLIQEGDSLGTNQPAQAVAKYTEAQTALLRFGRIYPGWNERVVKFRLNYLASKITLLSAPTAVANTPPPAPAATNPPPATVAQTNPPPATVAQTNTPSESGTRTNLVLIQQPGTMQTSAPPVAVQTNAAPPPAQETTSLVLVPQISVSDLQSQISDLQNQLRDLQGEKMTLEAKLREALAARPAGATPEELAQAQQQIRSIQKENELLQVSLEQERQKVAAAASREELEQTKRDLEETKRKLADEQARTARLTQENESLRVQVTTLTAANTSANNDMTALRTEYETFKKQATAKPQAESNNAPANVSKQLALAQATISALESDKEVWRLEKIALENRVRSLSNPTTSVTPLWGQESVRVKQLEQERDDLQKKLDTAQRELYGRNGQTTAARVDELASQLETLHARLDIYESKPVPYTAEEMALFKRPEPRAADPREGQKPVRELPAGTIELVAAAQKDFVAKSYADAEQKYLQVLSRDQKNANTLANLAAIELEMGHNDDAEKNIKKALAVAPDDSYSLSILGNLKFREEKFDEALDALGRAAKADPRSAEIQNFLGLVLSQKGMRNAAENAFRKAVILNPNYGGAQNNLAVFYLTQKPPAVELARWHYDKAVAVGFPRNPEMEKMMDGRSTPE